MRVFRSLVHPMWPEMVENVSRAENEMVYLVPEMVDEIVENIHETGGDVVEGDGGVTAAGKPLLLRVEGVVQVPEVRVQQPWSGQ